MNVRERRRELATWPADRLATRVVTLERSRDHWYRAAKQALAGDDRQLRCRVDGYENPLEAVLSALDEDTDA